MKMGMGQGCWKPLGHVSGGHVEKGRQDMAGHWVPACWKLLVASDS